MERFNDWPVILAQGPCESSLYHSSFSIRAAEVSTYLLYLYTKYIVT